MVDNIYSKCTDYVKPFHYDLNRGAVFRRGHYLSSCESSNNFFLVPNLLLSIFKTIRNKEGFLLNLMARDGKDSMLLQANILTKPIPTCVDCSVFSLFISGRFIDQS